MWDLPTRGDQEMIVDSLEASRVSHGLHLHPELLRRCLCQDREAMAAGLVAYSSSPQMPLAMSLHGLRQPQLQMPLETFIDLSSMRLSARLWSLMRVRHRDLFHVWVCIFGASVLLSCIQLLRKEGRFVPSQWRLEPMTTVLTTSGSQVCLKTRSGKTSL